MVCGFTPKHCHDRYTSPNKCIRNLSNEFPSALQYDRVNSSSFRKRLAFQDCLLFAFIIGTKGHISYSQRVWDCSYSPGMMKHFI